MVCALGSRGLPLRNTNCFASVSLYVGVQLRLQCARLQHELGTLHTGMKDGTVAEGRYNGACGNERGVSGVHTYCGGACKKARCVSSAVLHLDTCVCGSYTVR